MTTIETSLAAFDHDSAISKSLMWPLLRLQFKILIATHVFLSVFIYLYILFLYSFVLPMFLYGGVGLAGYRMFGEKTLSQITLNLPQNSLASKVALWTIVRNFGAALHYFCIFFFFLSRYICIVSNFVCFLFQAIIPLTKYPFLSLKWNYA